MSVKPLSLVQILAFRWRSNASHPVLFKAQKLNPISDVFNAPAKTGGRSIIVKTWLESVVEFCWSPSRTFDESFRHFVLSWQQRFGKLDARGCGLFELILSKHDAERRQRENYYDHPFMKQCFQLNLRVYLFFIVLQVIIRCGIRAEKKNNFILAWNMILKEMDNELSELNSAFH